MRALILIAMIALLASCKTIKQVEYIDRYHNNVSRDTITRIDRDSIYIKEWQKGDTIYLTKYVERIKYKDKVSIKIDTISVVKESVKTEVQKVVPKWCFIYIIISIIIFFVFLFYIKIK